MTSDTLKAIPRAPSPMLKVLAQFIRHPLGVVSTAVLSLIVFAAAFAPWLAPYDPVQVNWAHMAAPPSAEFWLGTDEIGRDILSRILYGARISLLVVFSSVAVAFFAGSAIGLIAGYFGGIVDSIIMRINDAALAFPMLILALAIIAVLGPGLTNAIIAIAIVNIPEFARIARAQTLAIREKEFIEAARAIGAPNANIIVFHVWPYVRGSIVIYASMRASAALITESALAFLGLGVQPPTPTWGGMLSIAMQYWDKWWMSVFPGLAIFIAVLAFNFAGDAWRDALTSTEEE